MIEPGSNVKLKGDELREGVVIEVKDNFAQVNVRNKNEWIPISELEERSDDVLNKILKNRLDDSLDFILGMDAYRLLTEYKFNPYVLASSTKIQIFPHQIDEVIWALENPRIMIADEVGLGKTIVAALVASELKARGLANKSLYVVPKSLVLKWKDELNDRFEADAQILNSEYVKVNPNPFTLDEFSFITSIDYLKQPHVTDIIKANFDLIVVDEAHKFKLNTDRLELGRLLAERSNTIMFLTATPHDGRDEDFMARISLLSPYVKDIASSNYLWSRNTKEDVIENIFGRENQCLHICFTFHQLV
jgi:SNF2 family DNA or RNA helicase